MWGGCLGALPSSASRTLGVWSWLFLLDVSGGWVKICPLDLPVAPGYIPVTDHTCLRLHGVVPRCLPVEELA